MWFPTQTLQTIDLRFDVALVSKPVSRGGAEEDDAQWEHYDRQEQGYCKFCSTVNSGVELNPILLAIGFRKTDSRRDAEDYINQQSRS